jgi:site-specific DNA-methyltransferase (adenine-specific)
MSVSILVGDCRDVLAAMPEASVDAVVTDPPYNQTSLAWDRWPHGWPAAARRVLKRTGSMWVFGSLRMFMDRCDEFTGWRMAQDIVWEKHNGSSFHADRFRRVHEQAVQFYRDDAPWAEVYKGKVTTPDATKKTARRKTRPTHMGNIEAGAYSSEDGGPRIMRSVIFVRSEHGRAVHPTQKPLGIIRPLIENACPPGGVVLDPFLGSGTTAIAAHEMGRSCIGIDLREECVAVARRRINGEAPLFAAAAE